MKILATSDNHIQRSGRWDECVRIHRFILEQVPRICPDLFIDGGDLYDAASTPEERLFAVEFIRGVADVCPFVIVAGNHERFRDIAILRSIESRYPIYVIEDHELLKIPTADGQVINLAGLAWPRPQAGALGRTVQSLAAETHDHVRRSLEDLGNQVTNRITPTSTQVLVAHLMPEGATLGPGQPLRGRDTNAVWNDLLLANPDVVLLGHVHAPSEREVGGVPVITIGTPYPTDFGEREAKSIVMLTREPGAPIRITRIPTPATPMRLIQATLDGEALAVNYAGAELTGIADVAGAEVRVEYIFDLERRDEARRLAQDLSAAMIAAGALSVDLKPVPRSRSTARAPEVAKATTLVDKVRALWNARNVVPTDDGRLTDFVRILDEQVGGAARSTQGVLRFLSIELEGFIAFPEKVAIDFESMTERFLAVMGRNGEGKSVLLGMLLGAIYRDVPGDRGPLNELATSRKAYVELRFEISGKVYRIRQAVDAKTGTGKTFIYNDQGVDLLEPEKNSVTAGDRWVAEHLPSEEVVLASVFAQQGGASLLTMPEAECRKVFNRAIGIERTEKMASAARKNAELAAEKVRTVQARLDDERARGGDPLRLQEALADAKRAAIAADQEADRTRLALAEATAAAADEAARLLDYDRRKAESRDLANRAETARAAAAEKAGLHDETDRQCRKLEGALADARVLRDRKGEVDAAQAKAAELDTQIRETQVKIAGIQPEIVSLTAEARRLETAAATHLGVVTKETARVTAMRAQQGEREAIERAQARLPKLQAELEAAGSASQTAAAAVDDQRKLIDRLGSERLAGADDRIRDLRGGLERIAADSEDDKARFQHPATAHATLLADDAVVQRTKDRPVEVERAKAALAMLVSGKQDADREVDRLRVEVQTCERTAARAGEIEKLAEAITTANELIERERAAANGADAERVTVNERLEALKASRRDLEASLGKIHHERETLNPTLDIAASVATAQARIEEISGRLTDAMATLERTRTERDALKAEAQDLARRAAESDPGDAPQTQNLDPLRQRETAAAKAARDAHARVAVAQEALDLSAASQARQDELMRDLSALESDVADWTRISNDLGRNGLQSLEIDAAGPLVSEIANDLLRTTYGTRYTVRIATTRPDDSGKRQIECLQIMVYDAKEGRETPSRRLSGGQRIVVGEAVALALSVYACDQAGARNCTLVRDENGAPLDVDAASAYVNMLREVMRKVEADKVLLVTHSPAVQEMADLRLIVQDGAVSVA